MERNDTSNKRKAAQAPSARLLAADELGLLKVIEVPAGPQWASSSIVATWGRPDKTRTVHALAAPDYTRTDVDVVAVARGGGAIDILDTQQGSTLCTLSPPDSNGTGSGPVSIPGLAFRHVSSEESQLELVSCSSTGLVRLHRLARHGGAGSAPQTADQLWGRWSLATSTQAAPCVGCMALDSGGAQVAVGGEGHQVQVLSLATQQEVFKAKGGKPNKVGNVDLPHVTAVAFLPDPSGQQFVAGTVKHKLWLYDMRAGRRPQLDLSWGEARITALAPEQSGKRVWASNGTGHIEALDLSARRMQGSMKGAAGSVRTLAPHPDSSQPLLAVAGLDRFVRVHSTETRAGLGKVYCKQQLTGVAWLRPPPCSSSGQPGQEEQEQEEGKGDAKLHSEAGATGRGEGKDGAQKTQQAKAGGKKQAGNSKSKKQKTGS